MSELVVRGLEKSFPGRDNTPTVAVLRGVDLAVPEGSLAAVLGPSGCGKTTLLRIIAGFDEADRGMVRLGGTVVSLPGMSVPPERRRVGVVPQEGALFPHLTVTGNVGFGLSRRERRSGRVEEVLELVGLAGFGSRMPHELSGGQQQRVALARALAPRPALVLLDEPFSALDTGLRAAVREDVRAALRAANATAVLVTHDQEEALSMADLVAVLADGRTAQLAAPTVLYSEPADLGVATFVGDAVVLEVVARGGAADSLLGPVQLRGADPSSRGAGRAVVRPEQIVLEPAGTGVTGPPGGPGTTGTVPGSVTGSVTGIVSGIVTGTTFYGHDALVRLRVGGVEVAARRQGPPEGFLPGSAVTVRVVGPVSFFPTHPSLPPPGPPSSPPPSPLSAPLPAPLPAHPSSP